MIVVEVLQQEKSCAFTTRALMMSMLMAEGQTEAMKNGKEEKERKVDTLITYIQKYQ